MTMTLTATKSKKPRNYHELPTLYFVAMDDWLDKLGEKPFCLYLKLWTMVDRTDEQEENHCIKTRTSKLIKKLDMSKSTYLRLIKPLYEYGLIDLVEYEGSKNEGSKPVNIIVHEYPQNKWELSTKELEKCRSWEQRIDDNYNFSKQGGRPKKGETPSIELPTAMIEPAIEPVEEPAPVEEPTPVPVSVPNLVPTPVPVPTFNGEVEFIVITEFEHFKEGMVRNGVDLEVVVNWVNNNCETIDRNSMCYVLKQLSTYPEPIRKTGSFILSTLEKASSFHTPVTLPKPPVSNVKRVPFYNWLEERD